MREKLGAAGVVDPESAPRYFEEPRGRWRGTAGVVARPATVEEVAFILAAASEARVGVVPWGGGTGLVGGQTLEHGPAPALLSLERMNRVRSVSAEENALVAEAGVPLAEAQAAARDAGRLLPLSLASEGSCTIGGVLAANAGGVATLRYGNARDLCLGVEAALPDGAIVRGLSPLRKNNLGLDLRHLLIGTEGVLGVITAASLKLSPEPGPAATAFLAVSSPADAVRLLRHVQSAVGETVSAFELMSRQGLDFVLEKIEGARDPLERPSPWSVLVEVASADAGSALEAALAEAFEADLAQDGVVASSEAQRAALWRLREETPIANRLIGAIASHDVSTPIGAIAAFIALASDAIASVDPRIRINCFGHVGDGNLHYNLFPPAGEDREAWRDRAPELTRIVHDLVHACGGSVAAEHGVGRAKVADLERYGDPAQLAALRAIKRALDPHGIMNPGAVLDWRRVYG